MKINNLNFDLVRYALQSYKLDFGQERKVVLIADMHDYTKDEEKAKALAEAIKRQDPHHVVIAGDNIQGAKWESERAVGDFSKFVENVSEAAPVFISQGNHDLVGLNESNADVRLGNFKNMENIRPGSVFPLINDKVVIDGFEIIGYTPSPEIISGLGIQNHGVAHDKFIDEYMQKGVKIEPSDKNITEFVGHNPNLIAQSENGIGLEGLVPIDTFYAGHLHNGYRRSSTTSANPDKYLDLGYVEKPYTQDKDGKLLSVNPLFFGQTNLCRGVVYVDDNSQQKILQLNNNKFYKNIDSNIYSESNQQTWISTTEQQARDEILNNKLHALVITGGIRKFFGFNVPGDSPEITEVTYKGTRR